MRPFIKCLFILYFLFLPLGIGVFFPSCKKQPEKSITRASPSSLSQDPKASIPDSEALRPIMNRLLKITQELKRRVDARVTMFSPAKVAQGLLDKIPPSPQNPAFEKQRSELRNALI